MNKYLTKIASRTDSILNATFNYGDRLMGSTARKYTHLADNLAGASRMGVDGVSPDAIRKAQELAKGHQVASRNTRIKTGLGAALATGTGYAGMHKYQQHKDNLIMQRILESESV